MVSPKPEGGALFRRCRHCFSLLMLLPLWTLAGCASWGHGPEPSLEDLDPALRAELAQREFGFAIQQRLDGDEAAAYLHLVRAAALDPESARVRRELGRVFLVADRPLEASMVLEESIVLGGNDSLGLKELSDAYRKLGRREEAIACLEVLHEAHPYRLDTLYRLHALLLLANREDRGLLVFGKIVKQTMPHWPFGHEAMGDFLLRDGQLESAERSYRRAIALGARGKSVHRKLELTRRKATATAHGSRSETSDPGVRIAPPEGAAATARPAIPSESP